MLAGFITPIISFAITGMPAIPIVFFMMFELAAYGAVAGFLHFGSKVNQPNWLVYPKLIIAMIAGRLVGGLAMFVGVWLFKLPINPVDTVTASLIAGLPGIALQIVLVPALYLLLKRGGFTFESQTAKT